MTSFQQALDFVDQAVSGGGGAQPPLTLDDAFSFVDSAIAAEMPGATPGARDEDIQAIAAQEYAGMVDVVPDIDVGIMPREVVRGAVGMFTQAAQAVATPGMRAQFIESVLSPMLMFQMPFLGSAARQEVARRAARTVSQALEPAGSGLSVEDVETEAMAMRGAQAGLAAGQREGFRAEASRAVGQVVPQAAAVAGAVLTGQPVVAAALASNAVMPLMGFTSGQIAYMDELDQKRADEAAAGKPLSEFDIGEMGRRGAITGAIAAGVEAVGAATGTRLVGKALAAAAKPATKNVAIARLAQAGQDKAARVLATRAGQAGAQAFARITAGTGQITNGFIGQAGKALALSAAEEGAEEFAEGMLNAPFTYTPMSEDLWNAVSAAAVGSVAGGVGGGIGVTGAVTQRALANRREAMRPETDKERILRQSHAEAIAKRVDWTKDLDDTQRAEIAVALDTLNGMDQEERGTFLQEMRDRQADAVNFIDMLLAERKQLDDAIAGLEVSERRMIEDQPRVEGERAAKQEAVREAEAAFTQAEADLAAAQEILAEAEGAAGVRPRVARPGRKIVTPEEARRNVESAQALVEEQRKNVTAALSQVEAAEGLEIDEGIRIDPVAMRADLLSDIAKNDAALKTAVTDKLIADARANAVAEKISDMPAVVEQKASGDVLSDLGTSMGQTFTQVKAPRKASKLTKDLAALGVNVVWFRSSGRFIPAFHSRKSRGTIYLNADMDPRTVRARAFEEMFHDIQMFQPDIAESYSELVGLAPIYRAGMEYVTRGGPESEQIGRLDVAAVEQLGAAGAALRGERAAIQPGVARAGAARLAQEGEANAFAEAAAAMTTNRVLAPISRFAARRGLMGREARAAMAVIDAAARSAAIAKVKGTQGDATLSPLARTLMWAEDLNVSYAREIEEATQPISRPVQVGVPSQIAPEGGRQYAEAEQPIERAAGDRGRVGAVRSLAPLEGAPRVSGATGPDPGLVAVAEQYAADNGITLRRQAYYAKVDEDRARRIADAYDAMPHAPNDPVVREAYENLIKQTMAQYRALERAGYSFYFYDETTDPYDGKPWNAMRDLRSNKRMAVFTSEAGFGTEPTDVSDNPLLAETGLSWPYGSPDGPQKRVLANDLFRAVHDAFGHGLEGAGFRADGEENAWQAHVRLFTGSAVGALTSETRGQNSWLNYGPYGEANRTAAVEDTTFATQKSGLMPSWTWQEGRVPDVSTPGISMAREFPSRPLSSFTPEWRAWFSDSKVVDADGNPRVVYHGTSAEDFNEFKPGRVSVYGRGIYFADNPSATNTYAGTGTGARVIPAYLRIENPFVYDETKNPSLSFNQSVELATGTAITPDTNIDEILSASGYDGVVVLTGSYSRRPLQILVAFRPNQIKSVFNERPTSAPGISMAREDSADIEAMRTEIAALQRQMRDVQNVTAAQRARAMREVNLLQRRLVTAQLIAEQKIGQAERLRKRMEREREVSESSIADAQEAIGRLERDLDEAEAALRSEREKAKAGPGSAAAIRSAQRAIDFAYRIGRREGLVAGEVRGQQVGLRETAAAERRAERAERRVVTSAERIDELLGRIGEAKAEISDLRRNIRTDAALAQRAADLAYRMGLRSGQVQGMMRGRQQVLRVLRRREDALARQLDNLRTLNALRSDQVAERAAIVRKIAADAVDMLPVRLRGPLAKRAATATTVQQANRIAVEATREAVNNEVSTALAVIKATRKKMNRRGMRNVTRERVETLLDQADAMLRDTANRRLAAKVVSGQKAGLGPGASVVTNAVSLYSAVLDASLLVEQAVAEVQAERDAWERERAARVARYADLKSRLGSNLAMRPTLEERARADESPRIGALASMQRAASDIYTLMLETEGTQDGALGELVSIAQRGKGESSLEHARMIRDLAPALSGAGYESLSDYALRNGLMGESAAETMDVVLGGRTLTLPVGKVLSVAAMDDETLGLMDGSQPITFRGAETTMRVSPTRQEIEAIRSSLTPGQRDLIDAMKSILETRVRDRVMDAIWRVEGDQPPIVRNYWPRIRKTDLDAETADVLRSASAAVRSALTSVGFAQARTGSKSPLVYDDAFRTWDRHLQVSLDMIHMAQPYRDALSVLTDGEIESALDQRMGDGTANILRAFFANGVGATARSNVTLIDAITNNVTGAILSLSPRTAAKVYVGGTIRLMSEMPSGLWARGVARATARAANPQSWSARIDEIHSVNGYFTRRHQMHMRSIVSGTLSDADRTTVSTALSAMAASLRGAGQNVAAGNFTDAARAVREVANGANMAVTAFVDALRYADEQIMLVAVEARLAEVEDEGILTGTEALREAALRAERDFRLTQNASDEFDETATVAMTRTAKGTPYIRFLFPFSSDPLKARNQIRRAWLTGEARARTALAITGNTATSTLIGAASTPALMAMYYAVMNAIGGDDEERKTLPPELQKEFDEQAKRIPVAVAREILSSATGYLGITVGAIVDSIVNRRPAFVPLAVRPVEQTAREAGRMFGEEGTMLRIIPATLALSQLAGMPFYQLYRFVEGFVPPSTVTPEERLRKKVERRTKALTPESVQERVRRRVEQLRRGG